MDVKTLSIDSIGLSNRSQNALHRAEIHTVGDMLVYTAESLSEIRNLGNKSIEEILKKINPYLHSVGSKALFCAVEASIS